MVRLLARWSVWLAATLVAADAAAQPSDGWTACRPAPTQACVFAEAVRRLRDDAPSRDLPRYDFWENEFIQRLLQIGEAKRDPILFDEAKRLAHRRAMPQDARQALFRVIAKAEARAGLVADAARSAALSDDEGPVSIEIVVFLAKAGRLDEALAVADRIGTPALRVGAWISLSATTRDAGFLDRVSATIGSIEDPYVHSAQTRDLAIAQAELGRLDEALQTLLGIAVPEHQAQALAHIGARSGDPGHIEDAKRRIAGLDDHHWDAWGTIVRAEIAMGRLAMARQTLKRREFELRAEVLAECAGEVAAAIWVQDGQKKAEAALNDIMAGYTDHLWNQARLALALGLADAGRFDSALLMAFVNEPDAIDAALARIAVRQAEARQLRQALDTVDKIKSPGVRSPALARIATLLSP